MDWGLLIYPDGRIGVEGQTYHGLPFHVPSLQGEIGSPVVGTGNLHPRNGDGQI